MTCPHCRSIVSVSASLCGRCGKLIVRPSAPPQVFKSSDESAANVLSRFHEQPEKAVIRSRYAVLIGTTYLGSGIPPLPGCKHDIETVSNMLTQRYSFLPENIKIISEADVTKANIESALHDLNDRTQIRADDQVLVYFSGHGAALETNTGDGRTQGYLVTHDARTEGLARSCVSMRSIWEPLERCKANQRLFICDACHSGHLADNKSLGIESILDAQMQELMAGTKQMSPRAAVQVITAGRRDEPVAAQAEDTRLSPFTHLMLTRMDSLANEGIRFTAKDLGEWLRNNFPDFIREYGLGTVSEPVIQNVCGSQGNFIFVPSGSL